MELQELIKRGRFIFSGAPKRLEVFKHVNGKNNAKDIAKLVGKSHSGALQELQKIKDVELIRLKESNGKELKKDGSLVYEKVPLAKHISLSYFHDPIKSQKNIKRDVKQSQGKNRSMSTRIPQDQEVLDICNGGETQLYEFKAAGTEVKKITKEISAMLHNKLGGILFYGVDDDGTISGTDKTAQVMDQSLQNSLKNMVSPAPIIKISQKNLFGQIILLLVVPPWDKKSVYHYDGRVLLRKGTNVFTATPDESRKLHKGEYII